MKLKVFRTIEEMDKDRRKLAAELDPMKGLAQTTELILQVYDVTREELSQRKWSDKIIVTKFE
jgi:hypothetical protein